MTAIAHLALGSMALGAGCGRALTALGLLGRQLVATIREAIDELTRTEREQLAGKRGVAVENFARSYKGDWRAFVGDLGQAGLRRVLGALPEQELRVVVLRAFDGYKTVLDGIGERKRMAS